MTNSNSKAKELLDARRRAPRMFAASKESYINMVTTILEMLEIKFNIQDFYVKHLGVINNTYLSTKDEVDDKWAHEVIDEAFKLIGIENESKKEEIQPL